LAGSDKNFIYGPKISRHTRRGTVDVTFCNLNDNKIKV